MLRTIALATITILLTGCVAGQNIKLAYEPAPQSTTTSSRPVALTVTDQRTYVTSGNKDPSYLGHYRAGFGNPWDVSNFKKVPLAEQLKNDLRKELQSLGFTDGTRGSANEVAVTIREWNFDAAVNARIWYDLHIRVVARDGSVSSATDVKNERVVNGNVMTGAKSAMEKELPVIYGEVIRQLIRDNPAAISALAK
jgi:uncharacterized lipoprotein YajG